MSLYAKLAVVAALLLSLAAGVWKIHHAGVKAGRAECLAEKLVATESARLREQAAQKTNERIDRENQIRKTNDRAVDAAAADSLRQLNAASASAAASAQCGSDDPRPAIASECAAALVAVDQHGRGLASQVTALQGYAREVCLAQ